MSEKKIDEPVGASGEVYRVVAAADLPGFTGIGWILVSVLDEDELASIDAPMSDAEREAALRSGQPLRFDNLGRPVVRQSAVAVRQHRYLLKQDAQGALAQACKREEEARRALAALGESHRKALQERSDASKELGKLREALGSERMKEILGS